MSEPRTFSYTGRFGVCLPYDGSWCRVFDEQGQELMGVKSVSENSGQEGCTFCPDNQGTDRPLMWGVFTVETVVAYLAVAA